MLQCINIYMDREQILDQITQGSPWDDGHIQWCVNLVANEPDDLIRVFARCWLEHHSVTLAQRLVPAQ